MSDCPSSLAAAEVRRLRPFSRKFYQRDSVELARALLGKVLVSQATKTPVAGRIVEVEAYRGPQDQAAHSANGRRTARNEVMWGPAGYLYVYFIYGMHWCMNVVAADREKPQAVLLRALEPLHGQELMRRRRSAGKAPKKPPHTAHLMRGPACLCKALGIDRSQNGWDLVGGKIQICAPDPLSMAPIPAHRIGVSPRIGVDYAGADARLPWRFYVRGSKAVSGPAKLRT